MRASWLPILLASLSLACDEDKADTDLPLPSGRDPVCPADPATTGLAGDANGDALVDIADAVTIARARFAGGAEPWCTDAADLTEDDRVEADDAYSLLLHLFEGTFDLPDRVSCDGEQPPRASCIDVHFDFEEADGVVYLRLTTGAAIQAWSLPITADCGLTATTASTAGASADTDPAGARSLGYDATFEDGHVTSAVVLSLTDEVAVSGTARILALTPDSCGCTITVGEPVATRGEPVEAVVVAGGTAYRPVQASVTTSCP